MYISGFPLVHTELRSDMNMSSVIRSDGSDIRISEVSTSQTGRLFGALFALGSGVFHQRVVGIGRFISIDSYQYVHKY